MTAQTTQAGVTTRGGAVMARSARVLLRYILLTLAVLLVLLALLTAAARIGLPYIAAYKPDIEAGLTEKLQNPVEIGTLDLRWDNFGPELRALDVRVIESDERQVKFDELLIDLNIVKSLWARLPMITELTLVGAELVVEQDESGSVRLHGVNVSGQASKPTRDSGVDVLSWLLKAEKVGLLDAQVTLVNGDENTLTLDGVNIRSENKGEIRQVRVDLELPDVLGDTLDIGADLSAMDDELNEASGELYVKATHLNLQGLHFLQSLFTVGGVEKSLFGDLDTVASVELWGTLDAGQISDARGQLTTGEIVNRPDGRVIIHSVESDLSYKFRRGEHAFTTSAIRLNHPSQGAVVRNVELKHNTIDGMLWRLSGQGDTLHLPMITDLLNSAQDISWLETARPNGELSNWRFDYALGGPDQKRRIAFTAGLQDFYMHPSQYAPGVNNVSGRIAIDNNKGVISLLGQQSTLAFPAWFETSIQVAAFTTDLNIDLSNETATKISGQVSLVDTGLGSTARVKVTLKPDEAPHLDLQGGFELEDVALVKPFLPKKVMSTSSYLWMNRALTNGRVKNGKVLLFGKLDEFPFDNGEGVFKVGFDAESAEVAAVPGWPSFEDVDARFDLNGLDMAVSVVRGSMAGIGITQATVQIEDLTDPWLTVIGTTDGTLQRMLQFANNGPLKRFLKPALGDATGSGRAQMDLVVKLPLRRQNSKPILTDLDIKGSVFLRNNDIRFDRANLELNDVVGAVGFTRSGVRIRNLKASTLGSSVRLDGDTTQVSGTQQTNLALSGVLSAKDVLQHYGLPLDTFVSGAAQWKVTLKVPHGAKQSAQGIRLVASSDLVGSSLLLPAPLGKNTGTARPMELLTRLDGDPASRTWYLSYGESLLSGRVVVKDQAMHSLALRFGGGAIRGDVAEGVRIDGRAPNFALDGWVSMVDQLIDELPKTGQKRPILPISANVQTNTLWMGDEDLGQAQLQINTDETFVNAVLRNDALRGNARYPRRHWKKDITAVARIDRFEKRVVDGLIAANERRGSRSDDTNAIDPTRLPPMDIRVSRLIWDQWDIKNLVLRTRPQVGGLSIDTLGLANESTQLIGEGYWRLRDPQKVNPVLHGKQITQLNLTLQSGDLGKSLVSMGMSGVMDEGEGIANASLQWHGPLYAPKKSELNGNFDIDFKRGALAGVGAWCRKIDGIVCAPDTTSKTHL